MSPSQPIEPELARSLSEKSDSELLGILENPTDWRPEVVDFARSELERRPISKTEIAEATPERGTQKRANEPLTSSESVVPIVFGAIFGLLGVVFLWIQASQFKRDGYTLKYTKSWRLFWFGFGAGYAVKFLLIVIAAVLFR